MRGLRERHILYLKRQEQQCLPSQPYLAVPGEKRESSSQMVPGYLPNAEVARDLATNNGVCRLHWIIHVDQGSLTPRKNHRLMDEGDPQPYMNGGLVRQPVPVSDGRNGEGTPDSNQG